MPFERVAASTLVHDRREPERPDQQRPQHLPRPRRRVRCSKRAPVGQLRPERALESRRSPSGASGHAELRATRPAARSARSAPLWSALEQRVSGPPVRDRLREPVAFRRAPRRSSRCEPVARVAVAAAPGDSSSSASSIASLDHGRAQMSSCNVASTSASSTSIGRPKLFAQTVAPALPVRRAAVERAAAVPPWLRGTVRGEPAAADATAGEPGEQIPRVCDVASRCRRRVLAPGARANRRCAAVHSASETIRRSGAGMRSHSSAGRRLRMLSGPSGRASASGSRRSRRGRAAGSSTSRTLLVAQAAGRPCCGARGGHAFGVERLRDARQPVARRRTARRSAARPPLLRR